MKMKLRYLIIPTFVTLLAALTTVQVIKYHKIKSFYQKFEKQVEAVMEVEKETRKKNVPIMCYPLPHPETALDRLPDQQKIVKADKPLEFGQGYLYHGRDGLDQCVMDNYVAGKSYFTRDGAWWALPPKGSKSPVVFVIDTQFFNSLLGDSPHDVTDENMKSEEALLRIRDRSDGIVDPYPVINGFSLDNTVEALTDQLTYYRYKLIIERPEIDPNGHKLKPGIEKLLTEDRLKIIPLFSPKLLEDDQHFFYVFSRYMAQRGLFYKIPPFKWRGEPFPPDTIHTPQDLVMHYAGLPDEEKQRLMTNRDIVEAFAGYAANHIGLAYLTEQMIAEIDLIDLCTPDSDLRKFEERALKVYDENFRMWEFSGIGKLYFEHLGKSSRIMLVADEIWTARELARKHNKYPDNSMFQTISCNFLGDTSIFIEAGVENLDEKIRYILDVSRVSSGSVVETYRKTLAAPKESVIQAKCFLYNQEMKGMDTGLDLVNMGRNLFTVADKLKWETTESGEPSAVLQPFVDLHTTAMYLMFRSTVFEKNYLPTPQKASK